MVRKILGLLVILMILIIFVSSSANPVIATSTKSEIDRSCLSNMMSRRIVEVGVVNRRVLLNVTEVNEHLGKWLSEVFRMSDYECVPCMAPGYRVEVKEVYNYSIDGRQIIFSKVRIYSRSISFSFKVLNYFVKTNTYVLSLITKIMGIRDENYFITAIDVTPKDEKKFIPIIDVIEIKNKTNLLEYYRILADVLNTIRRHDEVSWVWNKAKNELNYLSKVVEQHLGRYYVEGMGIAIVFDRWECALSCLSCALSTGAVIYNCWPCFAPCLSIFTVPTCALCLLTYRVIANIGTILSFASTVVSCADCAQCLLQ